MTHSQVSLGRFPRMRDKRLEKRAARSRSASSLSINLADGQSQFWP